MARLFSSSGRAVAQAVNRRRLTTESRVAPGLIRVGFVVDKVALGHVFLRVLRFSPVSMIPPSFPTLIYHLGDEQYVRSWQQFRDVVTLH
jgi:hypothetical protein